jgi:hypothetical protein
MSLKLFFIGMVLFGLAGGFVYLATGGDFSVSTTGDDPLEGSTTLSITGGSATGDKILLLTAVDGSGGYAEGTFTPSTVEAFTGYGPTAEFVLKERLNYAQCGYNFDDYGQVVQKVNAFIRSPIKPRDSGPRCTDVQGNSICGQGYATTKTGQCKYPNNNGQYPDCDCECVKFIDVGVAYQIDPGHTGEYELEKSLEIGNETYTSTLTNSQKQAEVQGITHKVVGSLTGDIQCDAPDSKIVAFIPKGKNEIQILDYREFENVISNKPGIYDGLEAEKSYNARVDSFLQSSGDAGDLCELYDVQTGLTEASVKCKPKPGTSLLIPLTLTEIPHGLLEVVKPSSTWVIDKVEVAEVDAANSAIAKVHVQNTGTQTASVDVSLLGPEKISVYSTRASIDAGETKVVSVNYRGSGIVDDFIVEVTDVNNPSNTASETVSLTINPYCPISSPGANFKKINTVFGCTYYCGESIYSSDQTADCDTITSYDRCEEYTTDPETNLASCTSKLHYDGYHCTGIGSYTTMDNYMDDVHEGLAPFIPAKIDNMVFITEHDDEMICDYAWKFGYGPEGKLSSARADYSLMPESASYAGATSLDEPDTVIQDISSEVEDRTGANPLLCGGFLLLVIVGAVGLYLDMK